MQQPAVAIVGRGRELGEIDRALRSNRIVTLVGAGGSGKTHLALHAAVAARATFGDSIWVVEFGQIQNEAAVGQQLLSALGGQRHADASVEGSIVQTLATRSTLLVLDNCEHLRESIAELSTELLRVCPELHILATSREPLDVQGERLFPLEPLERSSAVELFCARAIEQGVSVEADDPTVHHICEQLDDLPLAVELAAARTRSSSLGEIEAMLDERFSFLRNSGTAAREHHQTLAAAIAWSIDALGPALFVTISDLSVFASSFSLDAARAVVGRENDADIVDRLDDLVRRSVLQRVHRHGDSRFRLLESVRLYVRGLSPNDDAADRHLDYVLQRVTDLDTNHDESPTAALAAFAQEWGDIRKAFFHATNTDHRDKAIRLLARSGVAALMGMRFEYLDWAELVLSSDIEPTNQIEARALAGWAAFLGYRGNYQLGEELSKRALNAVPDDDLVRTAVAWSYSAAGDIGAADDVLREIVDADPTRPSMLRANATVLRTIFAVVGSRDVIAEVEDLRLFASGGDDVYEMARLFVTGCSEMRTNPADALANLRRSVELADRLGVEMCSMANRSLMAIGTTRIGSMEEALESVREALTWSGERGMWSSALNDFTTAAIVLAQAGRPEVAIMLLSAREHSGFADGFGTGRIDVAQHLRPADPELFDHCWSRGRTLTPRSATNYAIRTINELLASS